MPVKRALVCAPLMPEFDREGGSRRVFHLIEFLLRAGWSVSYIAHNATNGERYARVLRQMGVATYAGEASAFVNYTGDIDQVIANGKFDLAILVFWNIAEHYLPTLRALSPNTRIIVDSIDLHFLRNARKLIREDASDGHLGPLDSAYGSELVRELNVYAAADAVMTVSEKEADLIRNFLPEHDMYVSVPLMEDLPQSAVPFDDRKGMLFVGNYRHPPNVEAMQHFCEEIVPRIDDDVLAAHPLYIVGNGLEEIMDELPNEDDRIQLIGWVPSVLPYLQQARVSVVPLLHGAGTKTKLIQSLMVGTPSVSTTIGIEGLDVRDHEHVLVADDPTSFARAITQLLTDAVVWAGLARQGRTQILKAHGRDIVRAQFMSVVSTVFSREPKHHCVDSRLE